MAADPSDVQVEVDTGAGEEEEESEVMPDGMDREPVCGLHNIGNTCYLNSGVQVVANSGVFREMMRRHQGQEVSSLLRGGQDARRQQLLRTWRDLVDAMSASEGSSVDPRGFVYSVMSVNQQFLGFTQQDSHEFVSALLGALDDETRDPFHLPKVLASFTNTSPTSPHAARQILLYRTLDKMYTDNVDRDKRHAQRAAMRKGKLPGSVSGGAYYPRLYRSAVSEVYEGHYASCIRCTQCQGESLRAEPFLGLQLEVPPASRRPVLRMEVDQRRVRNVQCGAARDGVQASQSSAAPSTPREQQQQQQSGDGQAGTVAQSPGHGDGKVSRLDMRMMMAFAWQMVGGFTMSLFSFVMGAFYLFSNPNDSPDEQTTVYECLAAHFSNETINKYECPHCDKHTDGVKQLSLFDLPEELVLTFKRFSKNGYWISKIGGHIGFPICNFQQQQKRLEYPGAFDYVLPDSGAPHVPGNYDHVNPELLPNVDPVYLDVRDFCYVSDDLPPPDTTTFALHSMIVHRGSYHGGHYVSYIYSERFNTWVLCNDDRVAAIEPTHVRDEVAYVLVYKKRRKHHAPGTLSPEAVAAEAEQQRLCDFYKPRAKRFLRLLEEVDPAAMADMVGQELRVEPLFISREWLVQYVLSEEPGPICNLPSYHFDDNSKTMPTRYAKEFYCPIPPQDWDYLLATYGGGPAITRADYDRMKGVQENTLRLSRMPAAASAPVAPSPPEE